MSKEIGNPQQSREWYDRQKEQVDIPTFRSFAELLKLRDMINQGELPLFDREGLEVEGYTMESLIQTLIEKHMQAFDAINVGSGAFGKVYRVVFSTKKEKWEPSIAIKFTNLSPFDYGSPFSSNRLEASMAQEFTRTLFLKQVTPHVPMMFGYAATPDKFYVVTDYAQYDNLVTYFTGLPADSDYGRIMEVLYFQLVYTLDVLQTVYPGFRHMDLHAKNILVRAYDFEGSSGYTTRYGTAFLPNMGCQAVITDFDYAFVPRMMDNAETLFLLIGGHSFNQGYQYVPNKGVDLYRVTAAMKFFADRYNVRSTVMDHVFSIYESENGVPLISILRMPEDRSLWKWLPPPDEILQNIIPYYKEPVIPVKDIFFGSDLKPREGTVPLISDPSYRRILPVGDGATNLPPIFWEFIYDPEILKETTWEPFLNPFVQVKKWIRIDGFLNVTAEDIEKVVQEQRDLFAYYPVYLRLVVFGAYVTITQNKRTSNNEKPWEGEMWVRRLGLPDYLPAIRISKRVLEETLLIYTMQTWGSVKKKKEKES